MQIDIKNNANLVKLSDASSTIANLDDGNYLLTFLSGQDEVEVTLSTTALQTLGLQCVELMPDITPKFTVASAEDAHRQPAQILKHLDDRSIQTILREVSSETLINFTWYMKDVELLKMILKNMSKRAAEMLMDDLDEEWYGKNPDTALEAEALRGRVAVLTVMNTWRRLVADDELPDLLGAGHE